LIDFGEAVQLCINDIFIIKDEDIKKKVYSFPTLAFQCKIAKIRAPINGKLQAYWSEETRTIVIDKLFKKLKGSVCDIFNIINILKPIILSDMLLVNTKQSLSPM